jgi:hypothetical protein
MKKEKYSPDPEWDPVHKRNFESELFDFGASSWLRKSSDLLDVAKLLEPRLAERWEALKDFKRIGWMGDPRLRDFTGVYFLLVAYGIENLLKGAAIARSQPTDGVFVYKQLSRLHQEFEKTGKIPESVKTHDLFRLAQDAGISCSLEEEDLLRRLTRATEWYGRYPVPLGYLEMRGTEKFSDGKEYSLNYSGADDVARITRLLDKLHGELLVNPPAGPTEQDVTSGDSAASGPEGVGQ